MRSPTWRSLASILTVTGTAHFVVPEVFDRIVPRVLGAPRFWTLASGVAELVCAGALVSRRTRSLGGWGSAALFVAVFPANVTMAIAAFASPWTSAAYRAATALRLPLQVPLVWWAVRVARAGAAA